MESKQLRIVFMGTPDFAVGILDALILNEYNVVGVVTVADKPAGRGKKLTGSPVKNYALPHGIPILQPLNLKNETFISELNALKPDVQIVVAFRMLPKTVWALPKYGTFNLHASLLPAYRGAAPINWAIINGERETGVTTFFIDEKIDTGDIILQKKIGIEKDDDAGTLHDHLMEIGRQVVLDTVDLIAQGNVSRSNQPEIAPSAAPKLFKNDCKIDWKSGMINIHNFIKGLSPYPTAWTNFENDGLQGEFKIFKAHIEISDHQFNMGDLIISKNEIKVAVEGGFIIIDILQLPGRNKMDAKSLLNGFKFNASAKVI